MNRILLTIVSALILVGIVSGCDERRHYTKKTEQQVHVYKQHNASSSDDAWIYWYMFYYNNSWYYYSSPTYYPATSYNTFTWQSSPTSPVNTSAANISSSKGTPQEIDEVGEQTVENSELGQQMENTIDTTEQQISDMVSEGNPNTGDNANESPSTDSSSTSTDSGGSSGGDSGGGGDGGGGGGE